jgi:excisionase family DNA binding protein
MSNLIKEEEASRILGLSIQTLRNDRASKRRIPFLKLGKSVRYRLSDLEQYIESCRIGGRA